MDLRWVGLETWVSVREWPLETGYPVQGPVEVLYGVIPLEEGLPVEGKLVIGPKRQRETG